MSNPTWGSCGWGFGGYGAQPVETLPIGYYMNLITSQYRNSTNFNKFLYAMLKKFDDVSQVLVAMDTALDVDYAVGPQLDMLGQIVAANRRVGFNPSGGASPILDDDTYRIYIKAKAARNLWDGTIDGLQSVWQILFPQFQIAILDNQDMTCIVFVKGTFTSIMKDLINNGYIVPRPEGVLYTYVFGPYPVFGFNQVPGWIDGFDAGHWV